ncbi:hypothetical protein Q4534_12595 [Cyclobacterium sp. 1_MG-2023]|uniref:hypothetical protein n=1 Tax=Cyclobacterium sp. 1_MG-2023 TaxID=3062681 RepID=UPI0026E31142|nr:hypothetical protein [Cyclobacterium sp. 1_MG-2023]MDO6438255.1 hypothetical protein [Cyclobacterium sp. 1_MG-2023]
MKSINKYQLIALFVIALIPFIGKAQSQDDYFNKAAKQYVNDDIQGTSQLLAEGLEKYPEDAKLNALWEKLKNDQEDQEKQDQENQDEQNQEQQEQQEQDQQEQQDQESQDQESGEGEEQTEEDGADESDEMEEQRGEQTEENENSDEQSDMESDLSEREKAMEELKQRLEQMNITPEQAAQILDAMNSNELRYIQQNKKKPTQQPKRGLPDY